MQPDSNIGGRLAQIQEITFSYDS